MIIIWSNFAGIIAVVVGVLVRISFKTLVKVSFKVLLRVSSKAFSRCHNRYHKGYVYFYHLGYCGEHCRGINCLCHLKNILGIFWDVFARITAGIIMGFIASCSAILEGNFSCFYG